MPGRTALLLPMILVATAAAAAPAAEPGLYPCTDADGLWGYIDAGGAFAIVTRFWVERDPEDPFGMGVPHSLQGMIDRQGRRVGKQEVIRECRRGSR
jgi:hypothetical protein